MSVTQALQTRQAVVDGLTAGQEREVSDLSAVCSNAQGRIWFLADVRRLTVALTRARQGLIVIGSKSTLMNNQPESKCTYMCRRLPPQAVSVCDPGDDVVLLRPHADPHDFTYMCVLSAQCVF